MGTGTDTRCGLWVSLRWGAKAIQKLLEWSRKHLGWKAQWVQTHLWVQE